MGKRSIVCEFCGVEVTTSTGNQRTCLGDDCRKALRAKTRAELYYEKRPTPTCVWCEKPIYEPRKRRYHTECRADKNRLRVRAYYQSGRTRASGPRKSREFKAYLNCKFCQARVKRTGANQIICKSRVCINRLKQEGKKRRRERRNLLEKLHAEKDRKFQTKKQLRKTEPSVPWVYRTVRSLGA